VISIQNRQGCYSIVSFEKKKKTKLTREEPGRGNSSIAFACSKTSSGVWSWGYVVCIEKLAEEHKIDPIACVLVQHIGPTECGVEHEPVKIQGQHPQKLSDLQSGDSRAQTWNGTGKVNVHQYMNKAIGPHTEAERLEAANISNAGGCAMVKQMQEVQRLLLHYQHERVDQLQIFAPVEDVIKSGELGNVALEDEMIMDRGESSASSH